MSDWDAIGVRGLTPRRTWYARDFKGNMREWHLWPWTPPMSETRPAPQFTIDHRPHRRMMTCDNFVETGVET